MGKKKHHEAGFHTRQEKRDKFQATRHSSKKARLAVILAAFFLVTVFGIYFASGTKTGGDDRRDVSTIEGTDKEIKIPVAEVSDGKARFYSYTLADNQKITFFALKSSDGVIRTAFDTCDVCYKARLGYRQVGDDMVCNKCGRHFPSVYVNEVQGGCNPVPLSRTIEGNHLLVRQSDVQGGKYYF